MAVLRDKQCKDMIITGTCGCDEGFRLKVFEEDDDWFAMCSFFNANWYKEQDMTVWKVIKLKVQKIWSIIRNKDYYYADVVMSKAEFEEFRDYVNSVSKEGDYES